MATATLDVLNSATWEYQTPTTIMVPYRAEAIDFFPETFLPALYLRLQHQDLLSTSFPGMAMTHLNKFVAYMSLHPCLMCFARDGNQILDTAGFGHLTEIDGVDGARKAGFGFCFFREHHATQEARSLGWMMLKWWLVELKIDVLFGTTLRDNHLARNFSQNFGFEHVADIPNLFFRNNRLEDATLLMLEREKFLSKYQDWRRLNLESE